VDQVQDLVPHPNELTVRGKGMEALCRETDDSLHCVAQAKWVCHRGIPGEDIWEIDSLLASYIMTLAKEKLRARRSP
jgi:hypothetical protein